MTTSTAPDDVSYLLPLFNAVAPFRGPNAKLLSASPQPHSSLAADDTQLGSWRVSILVHSSLSAGVMHVDALIRLVTEAKALDPYSPWTLLRGALENFATSGWLLAGGDRMDRRCRALSLWDEDFRNRAQYERDTGWTPPRPKAKSGEQRREQIQRIAGGLGLTLRRPLANEIISAAAHEAGLDPDRARASWRVASGFAHGRFWPYMNATEPRSAAPLPDGYLFAFVVDDEKLKTLAMACEKLFVHAVERYQVRSAAP